MLTSLGKGAEQGGDILDRRQTSQNTQHHVAFLIINTGGFQPGRFVKRCGFFVKVQAIVDAHTFMGVKIPLDEHIFEQVRNGNVIVDKPQGTAVQQTDRPTLERIVHIVQLIVAVHRGNDRSAAEQLDQQTGNVCFCAMTVDDVGLFLPNQLDQTVIIIWDEPGKEGGCLDAHLLGGFGEITTAQADQRQIEALFQTGAQGKNMCFCAAAVTAAGNVEYFHTRNLLVGIYIHIYYITTDLFWSS